MKGRALLRALKSGLIAKGPQIAAGIGVGLMLIAGIRAVKKTPEAVKRIEEKKEEEKKDSLTVKETVEATWKCYLPSIVIFLIACLLIFGGQRVSARRAMAAATACSLSDNMLHQYQDAVKAVVGEKKEEEIRAVSAKNRVDNKPPITDQIVSTGKGSALCYDELSKKYFWSDPAKVREAILTLNERIMDERYISLNDYWSEIGLPETPIGKLVCWSVDKSKLDPDYECVVVQDGPYKGWPCLVISFYCGPEYNYCDRY